MPPSNYREEYMMEEQAIQADELDLKPRRSLEHGEDIRAILEDFPKIEMNASHQIIEKQDAKIVHEKQENELGKGNAQNNNSFSGLNNAVGILNWIIGIISNSGIPFDEKTRFDITFAEDIEDYESFDLSHFSFPIDVSKMDGLTRFAYFLEWNSAIHSGRGFDSTATVTLKNPELAVSLSLKLTKFQDSNSEDSEGEAKERFQENNHSNHENNDQESDDKK